MSKSTIYRTYLGFFLSGIFVLSIGAILPDLMEMMTMSYSDAGMILSMFALGNLFSNFIYPFIADRLSSKTSIVILSALIPAGFYAILLFPHALKDILWFIFLLMGIGRGSISIISNAIVNDVSDNVSRDLNILHTIFAIGAGIATFLIFFLTTLGLSFENILLVLALMMTLSTINYLTMNIHLDDSKSKKKSTNSDKKLDLAFFAIAFVLFFYVGFENTVNGWFMTYLKESGAVSSVLAASLVSLTWLMIMIGRLTTAGLTRYIKGTVIIVCGSIGALISFIALISTQNPTIITLSILSLGIFLSGIYPTSIASLQSYIVGNQKRLALLLTCAAIGGIITPQLIGIIADRTSMTFAINILTINGIAMVGSALLGYMLLNKKNK